MPNLLQTSLFEESTTSMPEIPGVTYIPNYITQAQEIELLGIIGNQTWLTDLMRRVQHYGYKYDYKARGVSSDLKLGNLPDWISSYCNQLYQQQHFPKIPDQVIINEYQPGQGIASHLDCIPSFEETIASLSLGSACVMEFIHNKTKKKISLLLEPRSLVILKGDARYIWKHGISGRKTDKYNGRVITRNRRVSCTFRNVILSPTTTNYA